MAEPRTGRDPQPGADDRAHRPSPDHRRPEGLDDATVRALGKMSEALETVEHARGLLYGFHRLTGRGDILLGEAVDELREAGHGELADQVEAELVGRNVISGRWTFQVVEDYDDGYWSTFRRWEATAREQLAGGRRHLLEAEMKESERTHGRPGHEARPPDES